MGERRVRTFFLRVDLKGETYRCDDLPRLRVYVRVCM